MRPASILVLLVLAGLSALPAADAFEVVVSAQSCRTAADHVLVEVVVLDSEQAALPGLIQLRFAGATAPDWTASGLPARRLLVTPVAGHYTVREDRGPVALSGEDEPLTPPEAPSVEALAARAADLARGEEEPPAEPPAERWTTIERRVLVLDSGGTLLVACLDGALETGGAIRDGDPVSVLVVASDGRFAMLSNVHARAGETLVLRQVVRVDDAD